MANQCNTCGGFEQLDVCMSCLTVVCEHCKPNHGYLCEELQKRKKRGEGRTIANIQVPPHRHGHETPADIDRIVSKPAILTAPYDLSTSLSVDPAGSRSGLWGYAQSQMTPDGRAIDPIDQSLQAVKDLIKEA